jgi:glycosyltransferase involved in cell wall biosynthesis
MELLKSSGDFVFRQDKKKILFLIPSLRIGGAEKVCCNICDNLNFTKHDVYIISMSDQIPLVNTLRNKSKIKILTCKEPNPLKFPWFSIKSILRFYKYIREIKPNIIHSHLWGMSCIYLYLFLFYSPKPVFVATIHSSEFIYTSKKINHKIFKFVENSIYKLLRFNLISVSTAVDKMVRDKLYFKTLSKVNNGIDTSIRIDAQKLNGLKKTLKLETAYPIIIHIGRATYEKRQEDIIKSVPNLLVKYPRTKLLLVGRDNSLKFTNLVKQLSIINSVLLLDERNDVSHLLHISDVGIFPSLFEGLPLALVEMMAAGLPLIVSDIPVLKDVTGFGLAALYVPVKSPEFISYAIIKILDDPNLMKHISTNARKIAIERYSLKSMIKRYEELYQSLT